jgi:hypothetical protein
MLCGEGGSDKSDDKMDSMKQLQSSDLEVSPSFHFGVYTVVLCLKFLSFLHVTPEDVTCQYVCLF